MKYWQKPGDPTTAVLKFYGEIHQWFNSANDFTATIREIELSYRHLECRMHCYGGVVFEGNVIFNAIKNSTLTKKVLYVDGVAASMGSIVMLAFDEVIIAENGFVMIHSPSSYVDGTANDFFNMGKLLKSMQVNFSREYIRKTGKQQRDVDAWFDGGDHWFDAQEAKAAGLVDEIASPVSMVADNAKPDVGSNIESVFNRFTALLALPTIPKITTPNNNMDKKLIISQFGLTGVTADSSDNDVLNALTAKQKADSDKIAELNAQVKASAEQQIANLIEARSTAINVKFTDKQIADFKVVGDKAGIEALKTVLNAISAVPLVENMITGGAGGGDMRTNDIPKERASWTFDEWQEKDPNGLEARAKANPDWFNTLYNAKFSK